MASFLWRRIFQSFRTQCNKNLVRVELRRLLSWAADLMYEDAARSLKICIKLSFRKPRFRLANWASIQTSLMRVLIVEAQLKMKEEKSSSKSQYHIKARELAKMRIKKLCKNSFRKEIQRLAMNLFQGKTQKSRFRSKLRARIQLVFWLEKLCL